jgi:hypothetical protein
MVSGLLDGSIVAVGEQGDASFRVSVGPPGSDPHACDIVELVMDVRWLMRSVVYWLFEVNSTFAFLAVGWAQLV